MPTASFEKEWKQIKTNFEKATNKKKPGEKFMGLFNTSSGLTPATAGLDKALAAKDVDKSRKALETLQKSADTYSKTLAKAAAAETDRTVQAETKVMLGEIGKLVEDAAAAVKDSGKLETVKNIGDFAAMMKNKGVGDRVQSAAKATYNEETFGFLQAMVKKEYSKKTYETFIKDGAKNQVNIGGDMIKKFDPSDLKKGPWTAVTNECLKLFNTNVVPYINKQAGA